MSFVALPLLTRSRSGFQVHSSYSLKLWRIVVSHHHARTWKVDELPNGHAVYIGLSSVLGSSPSTSTDTISRLKSVIFWIFLGWSAQWDRNPISGINITPASIFVKELCTVQIGQVFFSCHFRRMIMIILHSLLGWIASTFSAFHQSTSTSSVTPLPRWLLDWRERDLLLWTPQKRTNLILSPCAWRFGDNIMNMNQEQGLDE